MPWSEEAWSEEAKALAGAILVPAACISLVFPMMRKVLTTGSRGLATSGLAPAVAVCVALGASQVLLRGIPSIPPPMPHDGVWFLAMLGAVLLLPEEWIPLWKRVRVPLLLLSSGALVLWLLHPLTWSWTKQESASRLGGAAAILVLLVTLSEQAMGEAAPRSSLSMLALISAGAAACIFQGGYVAGAEWATTLAACLFLLSLFPAARNRPLGVASVLVIDLVLFASLLLGCFHSEMPLSQAFLICGAWLALLCSHLPRAGLRPVARFALPTALTAIAVFLALS